MDRMSWINIISQIGFAIALLLMSFFHFWEINSTVYFLVAMTSGFLLILNTIVIHIIQSKDYTPKPEKEKTE